MKVTSSPDSHSQIKIFVTLGDFIKFLTMYLLGKYFVHGVNCTHISLFSGLELMKDLFLFS